MKEKICIDEFGEEKNFVYDDDEKELYQKYSSGGDEEIILENIYNENNQLVSKVEYFAFEKSQVDKSDIEGWFFKEFIFNNKKQGYWLSEISRINYVNGKKVYECFVDEEEWFDYDVDGKLIRSVDSNDIEKKYEYDNSENLIRIKKYDVNEKYFQQNFVEQNSQMKNKKYFIDNQNCLWIPNNDEAVTDEFVNQLASVNLFSGDSKKKLYLNHSIFMDKFESSDVIVPENIEVFFYRITFRNRIKRIFIPASVKKIVVSPSSDYYVEEHSVEFIVSKDNENFISVNGSVYTKDFKTLIYCAQKKNETFFLDSRCEEIADSCKMFVNKKMNFNNTDVVPNLKTINFWSLVSKSNKLILPEGVENLKKYFLGIIKYNDKNILYISSTVKNIEGNFYSKYKVNKKNKTYATYKNNLYSFNYKIFFAGNKKKLKIKNGCEEIYFSGINCEKIYLPKSVKNIFELNSTLENICFSVHKENKFFSEYMGSLYTKDFESLLFLHIKSNKGLNEIHIHPNCKRIDDNAGIQKYRTKIDKIFGGSLFETEEQIQLLIQMIFQKLNCEKKYVEIKNFTMENFRNSIENQFVRFGFSGINIDKDLIFTDEFTLLNCHNEETQIEKPFFCQKEDLELAKDFMQESWNGILLDCKMVNVIDKLNKANYKTRFCCSGHILHSEHITSNKKTIANVLSRKPFGTICYGYIYFDCIPNEFKKIFAKLPNLRQDKLYEKIQDSYTEPVFYFGIDKKQNRSTIQFYYQNSIEEQNKAIEMLNEKLSLFFE